MRLLPVFACLLCASAAPLASAQSAPQNAAQNAAAPPSVRYTGDGGTNGVMNSIFVPPVANAPFTLTLSTEWSHPLPNGGSMTLANQRHIARDGRGRIYQERWVLVPKGSRMKSQMNVVQIMDPELHTLHNCFVFQKTCELVTYRLLSGTTYKPNIGVAGPLPENSGTREVENLGVASTAGADTTGYRITTTINPGVLGNDRPMVTTREFWYSPQLHLSLHSVVDDPQTGRQQFTVSDLTTSEPDPRLFELPAGYKVVDLRKPAPASN